jgi:hypothetical protein
MICAAERTDVPDDAGSDPPDELVKFEDEESEDEVVVGEAPDDTGRRVWKNSMLERGIPIFEEHPFVWTKLPFLGAIVADEIGELIEIEEYLPELCTEKRSEEGRRSEKYGLFILQRYVYFGYGWWPSEPSGNLWDRPGKHWPLQVMIFLLSEDLDRMTDVG